MHTSRIRGQALVDPLGAQVSQIELDVIEALRPRESAALQDLRHLRTGNDIARRQLHHLGRILLHEALAPVVAQVSAFPAAAFRHEDARWHQPGGVELQELRVLQGQTRAVRDGLSIARHGLRVGGESIQVPQPAGSNQESLAAQDEELARGRIEQRQAGKPSAFEQQRRDEAFIVAFEVVVLDQGIVEGLHLEKAGLVGRHARPRKRMASKRPLHDAAVLAPRPRDSPVLQQADLVGRGPHKPIHHVLVRQEIGPLDGVPGVQIDAVSFLGTHHRGGASFRTHRMRAHDLHFRHDGDIGHAPRPDADLHGGAQAGESGSQDHDIMGCLLHFLLLRARL
jgi:hypothetical protein